MTNQSDKSTETVDRDRLTMSYVPIDQLVPYERNSRKHPARQIEALRASIRQLGFGTALGVWQGNMILAGHGRVEAAKLEGFTELPCLDLSHLTFEQARAFVISDNKISDLGEWDDDLAASELQALLSSPLNINLEDLGFSTAELVNLLQPGAANDAPHPVNDASARPSARPPAPDVGPAPAAQNPSSPPEAPPARRTKTPPPKTSAPAPVPNDDIQPGSRIPVYGFQILSAGQDWQCGPHNLTIGDDESHSALGQAYDILRRFRKASGSEPVLRDGDMCDADVTLSELEANWVHLQSRNTDQKPAPLEDAA